MAGAEEDAPPDETLIASAKENHRSRTASPCHK
jgi:hypothetical protein